MATELDKFYEHGRRHRDRDDDDAPARRAPRVARDGDPEAGGGRGPLVRHPRGRRSFATSPRDPHVNLSYYKDRTREWISVSGIAKMTRDRAKIRELYAPDWKIWFGDEGDPRHGTADDPRMVLIGIDIHAAVFLEVDKPQPVVLFELVKGWVTGTEPDLGKMHHLPGSDGSDTGQTQVREHR